LLDKISKSVKYSTLTLLIILFILEFVIFPPLSSQIKYNSFTYSDSISEFFDNQPIENTFVEQPKLTTIKNIRENPEKYVGQEVSVKGEIRPSNVYYHINRKGVSNIALMDKNEYVLHFYDAGTMLSISSQINSKGSLVSPGLFDDCIVKGEIKTIKVTSTGYNELELIVIVPHEINFDGLTWSIPIPTPTPEVITIVV